MAPRLPDAGSKLRHWPPGTNNSTFVPSFFARGWRSAQNAGIQPLLCMSITPGAARAKGPMGGIALAAAANPEFPYNSSQQHGPPGPARYRRQAIAPVPAWGRHGFDGIDCGYGDMPGCEHP